MNLKAFGMAAAVALAATMCGAADDGPRDLLNLSPVKKGEKRFKLNLERDWPEKPGEASVCLWKDDKYAACSITIDDNCAQDHDWWLAQAEKHGFKLTWFVITGNVGKKDTRQTGTWDGWQRIVDAGHAVESHTTTHNYNGKGRPVVTDEELHAMYRDSLAEINRRLKGHRATTIAYPNGQAHPEIARRYAIACRGVNGILNDANAIDYLNTNKGNFWKPFVDVLLTGRTDVQANKWLNFKNQGNRRGWMTPLRHQVREGRTPEKKAAAAKKLEEALEYMGRFKDEIWYGTFPACAKYGQSRDTAELTSVLKDSKIVVTLRDRMKDGFFDEPLTVKVRLPDGWKGVAAKQAGQACATRFVEHDGAPYALVDILPDRGETTIVKE